MSGASNGPVPAYFIPHGERHPDREGSLAAWCPWCEAVHFHGAAGGGAARRIEGRGAHCASAKVSPLAGWGVELDVTGTVADGEDLAPKPYLAVRDDPLHSRVRLHHALRDGAVALALIRTMFGKRPAAGFDARLHGGACHVFAGGSTWWITDEAGKTVGEGHGLGRLLARLFGVSLGIVALRILESALGVTLPSDYRLTLADLVDRAEAGRPAPILLEQEGS